MSKWVFTTENEFSRTTETKVCVPEQRLSIWKIARDTAEYPLLPILCLEAASCGILAFGLMKQNSERWNRLGQWYEMWKLPANTESATERGSNKEGAPYLLSYIIASRWYTWLSYWFWFYSVESGIWGQTRKRGWTLLILKSSESAVVNYWTAAKGSLQKLPFLSSQHSRFLH